MSTTRRTGCSETTAVSSAPAGPHSSSPCSCSPATAVDAGDPLVVLESMKMETTVTAPFAGEVAEVCVVGQHRRSSRRRPCCVSARLRSLHRSQAAGWTSPNWARSPTRGSAAGSARTRRCTRTCMGFDLDPTAVAEVLGRAAPAVPASAPRRRRPAAGRGATARPVRRRQRAAPAATRSRRRRFRHVGSRSTCCPTCNGSTPTGPGCPTRSAAQLLNMLARYDVH